MKKDDQHAGSDVSKTRIEQADARVERAEARTELAETRTEQAEIRTEQAKTRTEQAKTRTEFAESRTEQAEIRANQAETRTEQAEATLQQMIDKGESVRGEISSPPQDIASAGAAEPEGLLKELTGRQREVLQFIAESQSTKQIAEILKISPKTVEYHRMKAMKRLNIHDVPGLVRFAVRVGLVPKEKLATHGSLPEKLPSCSQA